MKKNTTIKVFVTLFPIIFIGMACSNEINSLGDRVKLNIYGPTDCHYTLEIVRDSVHIISRNIFYNSNKPDTLILNLDTTFSIESQKMILACFNRIKKQPPEADKLVKNDAHQFELFLNQKLIAAGHCCNSEVHELLKICLPYIDEKKIACSSFFSVIEQINKYK